MFCWFCKTPTGNTAINIRNIDYKIKQVDNIWNIKHGNNIENKVMCLMLDFAINETHHFPMIIGTDRYLRKVGIITIKIHGVSSSSYRITGSQILPWEVMRNNF